MKIGELTLNQAKEICKKNKHCQKCKLYILYLGCLLHIMFPAKWDNEWMEKEIKT